MFKIHVDRDVEGYLPERGQVGRIGEEVPDRISNAKDFGRTPVTDDRTAHVVAKVAQFRRESGDRHVKTIVIRVDRLRSVPGTPAHRFARALPWR